MSANQTTTITNREKWALEAKAKQGWKCYFIQREWIDELSNARDNARQTAQELRSGATLNITHLTNMFLELYDKVGEICDCPICFEALVKDNTFVATCGHLVCKECKTKISECPICKRKY